MEEKVTLTEVGQPEPIEETVLSEEDTTPKTDRPPENFIEIKFNKEIRKLGLEEAATLAQKGLKFDMISEDFEMLKELSKREGKSPSQYLKELKNQRDTLRLDELTAKCSGDSELAEKLFKAEEKDQTDDFLSLKKEFPELASADDIPEEVKTAAEIKGTGLLFEYLLYEHRENLAAKEELNRREIAEKASLGSLSFGSDRSAVDAEFLKGIWGK